MVTYEFRVIMLHEFKRGHNATKATQIINQAWGEGSVSERTTRLWFQRFSDGDISLGNQDRGRPESKVDDDQLKQLVESNTQITVREAAEELNISIATVSRKLKAIGKVKKMDKWVPHNLNEIQKIQRYQICFSLIQRNKFEPFLSRIITCDEKWMLYDNRKRSAQWLNKNESAKQVLKPNLHPKKVMVTVWWCSTGVIHYSFLKSGETITSDKYCTEIDEMHEKLCQKIPALVNRKGPILLHDNARPHISRKTLQKLNQLQYEVLPHPPYSPDLSPTDFHFFKHLELFTRQKNFADQPMVEKAFRCFIDSRDANFYSVGINNLVTRWQRCVDCNGAYFD